MKVRDVDATWVMDFNSVRHGKHIMGVGGKNPVTFLPQIVVKDYNQQVPLSYYYVGTEQEPETAVID